jgi:uncharacterized membrane protein YgdD (TMEM256/DUF423 family)
MRLGAPGEKGNVVFLRGKAMPRANLFLLMARVLAFVQFLIISIGAFTLHLLVKIDHGNAEPSLLAGAAGFLARHALWLFAVPILYAAVFNALLRKGGEKGVNTVGVVLCLLLVVLLGIPIAYHLG